ncbi:hypothetical protein ACFO1V_00325 [Daeguia caeni]|uniref:Uncharacterized protein n=1 Tax=Daeguia caeni TaxID=439612 RepID=A0ABV9H2W3_9HYPH
MVKLLAVLLMMLMALHVIKPFGLPGLRRRGDFWKIAVVALLAMGLAFAMHLAGH